MKKLVLIALLLSACGGKSNIEINGTVSSEIQLSASSEALLGVWDCQNQYDEIQIIIDDVVTFHPNGHLEIEGLFKQSDVRLKMVSQGKWTLHQNQLTYTIEQDDVQLAHSAEEIKQWDKEKSASAHALLAILKSSNYPIIFENQIIEFKPKKRFVFQDTEQHQTVCTFKK